MLDEHERELLFDIERRLLVEDPNFVRSFGAAPHARPREHHRCTDMIATVAGLMLWTVLLIGPRPLTEAETTARASSTPLRATTPAPGEPAPRCRTPHEMRCRW